MTILELLKIAKEKISNPDHWCQNMPAQDVNGKFCHATAPEAYRWCAAGAVWSSTDDCNLRRETLSLLHVTAQGLPEAIELDNPCTFDVNDKLNHETVMKLLDKAISNLETVS